MMSSDAPTAPASAEADPPPGTGAFEAKASNNSASVSFEYPLMRDTCFQRGGRLQAAQSLTSQSLRV